ncbi:MAG TPA: glycoside hydrolase family 2 TIM barrel-domain containing protein [Rhabdaerophilum sp.]|nr:glycoside hydrolase family 2 TIM barrel-domain containing protein [Rhabdaerophilum sp.]
MDGAVIGAPDPYFHLGDEDYAVPFAEGRVGAAQMLAMAGRPVLALDGIWRFVLDLHDEGLRQRWYAEEPGPMGEWVLPLDYDDGDWQRAPVPSCWNVLKPEWFYFEGSGWYSREIDLPAPEAGRRLFLRCGAANYAARVFLNGVFVGEHLGGSTPFFVELTGTARQGRNTLRIQVENRRTSDRVPMNHTDWFNYGGLYRDVALVSVPAVFIRDFGVALVPGSNGRRIFVEVELSESVDAEAVARIEGLEECVVVPVRRGRGRVEIDCAPRLWHPDTPHLYAVSITAGEDRVTDRIGFREIRVEGERLLLNGEDLFLRGICVHEDDIGLGKATSEEDLRRRFRHVRALNANFVRLSHYPHHERAAEIADEEGILLWEEIPVYWAIEFDNPATLADARNQLLELIRRDRNRASVIIWGVGNENHDSDARLAFMSRLAETARAADPTRLISAACLIDREEFRIADRLADVLDVIGINEYFGWYEPGFDGLERLLARSAPGKPVVITETGADGLAGHRDPQGRIYSEEHQARILTEQLTVLSGASYVRGICPWILYDFRAERRQTALHRGYNLKGLIGADKKTRKQAFDIVADRYLAWSRAASGPDESDRERLPRHPAGDKNNRRKT